MEIFPICFHGRSWAESFHRILHLSVNARKGRDPQGTGTPLGEQRLLGKILFFAAMLNKSKAKKHMHRFDAVCRQRGMTIISEMLKIFLDNRRECAIIGIQVRTSIDKM